jgi:GT2 family glycosyltransferase
MQVDIVIATYNRADTLKETIENVLSTAHGFNKLFVIDNASTDHTRAVLESFKDERLIPIFNEENLGAAGGKNVGLRISTADVVIVIDDDAVFSTTDPVSEVIRIFNGTENLGLIQFKIINFQSRKVLGYEFPGIHPDTDQDKSFNIGYFIGAGHAIRKSMLDQVGYYPDDFGLYAHEEIDLSYRAINHGFIMRYEPSIAVFHKKAPGGRLPAKAVLYQLLLNRMIMSKKYLPLRYAFISNLLWIFRTLYQSKSILLIIHVLRDYRFKVACISASVLSPQALIYMKKNNGRLYK